MKRILGQSSFSDSGLPSDGSSGSPAKGSKSAKQTRFRLDLRRSLQMHRNLALGFAIAGLVLSVAYLMMLQEADTGEIRSALLLAIAFIAIGVLAAIAAHNRDRRIHIAADVEHLLGFAPMATLPDFSDVSDAVAGKCLLRLASAIDSACRDGSFKNCIFVGTGSGAGVTTIAGRVREALGVRDAGTHPGEETNSPAAAEVAVRDGEGPSGASERSMAVLQRVVEEAGRRHEGLVVGEAAPLGVWAEADSLASFAGCTIVVIESGVTTWTQLREAARSLERVETGAVGFVLNRVRLTKADAAFRRSIEKMEREVKRGSRKEERAEPQAGSVRVEPQRAEAAPKPEAVAASQRTEAPEPLPRIDPYLQEMEREVSAAERNAAWESNGSPKWLAERAAKTDRTLTQARHENGGDREAVASHANGDERAQEPESQAQGNDTHFQLPRLSGLRGGLFWTGIKELDAVKHGTRHHAEADELMRHIAPLASLFEGSNPAGIFARGAMAHAEPEHQAAMRSNDPSAETKASAQATNETGAPSNGSPTGTSKAEILHAKGGKPGNDGTQGDGRVPLDEVQLLPSKRGQYRRRD
ncbi:MAG: hypothetical protein WBC92_00740 [Terracidiphilus sp.]